MQGLPNYRLRITLLVDLQGHMQLEAQCKVHLWHCTRVTQRIFLQEHTRLNMAMLG